MEEFTTDLPLNFETGTAVEVIDSTDGNYTSIFITTPVIEEPHTSDTANCKHWNDLTDNGKFPASMIGKELQISITFGEEYTGDDCYICSMDKATSALYEQLPGAHISITVR